MTIHFTDRRSIEYVMDLMGVTEIHALGLLFEHTSFPFGTFGEIKMKVDSWKRRAK